MNETSNSAWQARLSEMETWYRDFLGLGRARVEEDLLWDYEPYALLLRTLRGQIIDVGGGAGLAGRFLSPGCEYVVVDPSPVWAEPEWRDISEEFNRGGVKPSFVTGTGEALPFSDAKFDGLLAFWSFNHAADALACVDEASRVLKPGARALIVLEDMIPGWGDVARLWIQELAERHLGRKRQFPIGWSQKGLEDAAATASFKLSGGRWPLQDDHIRIEDDAFQAELKGRFRVVDRNWKGGFLSYELLRR